MSVSCVLGRHNEKTTGNVPVVLCAVVLRLSDRQAEHGVWKVRDHVYHDQFAATGQLLGADGSASLVVLVEPALQPHGPVGPVAEALAGFAGLGFVFGSHVSCSPVPMCLSA